MTPERINPDDYYFVVMNGDPLQPANTDMIMDYWYAETIKEFLDIVCPDDKIEIVKAVFIEDSKRQEMPNLRVVE